MKTAHRLFSGCLIASTTATAAPLDASPTVATETVATETVATETVASAISSSALKTSKQPLRDAAASVRRLDLSPAVLKSAVAAAEPPPTPRGAFGTQQVTSQSRIDRAFQSAQIEGCMSDGALKFDPLPVWGDFVMGILAVPYTLHAMATGRCKLLSK